GDAPGEDARIEETRRASARGAQVKDLFVGDYVESHLEAMLRELGPAVASGQLKYLEDIREGLEIVPAAFAEMLRGGNFGKTLVRIADDPTLPAA
ncbi:MAG: oxidoreductase, zinc-binding dehydrogenase family, partial [Phenylobacterium sp.]|nr:oxidoreductase, zinc-binding dehydrogenase family [Phenylobacterium sp.]